jgi:hypothetical protein
MVASIGHDILLGSGLILASLAALVTILLVVARIVREDPEAVA